MDSHFSTHLNDSENLISLKRAHPSELELRFWRTLNPRMYGSCYLLRSAIMKENELGLLDPVLPTLAVMILTAIVQQSMYTGVLTPDQQREIHLHILNGDYTDEELELLEDLFDAICTGNVVRQDI